MQPVPPSTTTLGFPLSDSTKAPLANPNDKPMEDYAKDFLFGSLLCVRLRIGTDARPCIAPRTARVRWSAVAVVAPVSCAAGRAGQGTAQWPGIQEEMSL